MSLKILQISDVHMSNKLPQAVHVEDGKTDRLLDQERLWDQVARDAEDCDAVFVLGDLFDKALVDPIVNESTARSLMKLPVPTYLLSGNHDAATLRGERYALEAFGAFNTPHLHYLDNGMPLCLGDGVTFWPVHFVTRDVFRDELRAIRTAISDAGNELGYNVLLCHQSIVGCSHLGWVCNDGVTADEVCKGFTRVYSGHFHEHQRFGPEDIGMYLGSPMQHSYGDVGREPGYWITEVEDDGNITDTLVPTGLPKFWTVDALDADPPEDAKPGDFIRIQPRLPHADVVALKPASQERIAKLAKDGYRAEWKPRVISATHERLS